MSEYYDLALQIPLPRCALPTTIKDIAIGIALLDARRTILKVNKAFCTCLGYVPEALVGRSFDAIVHPEDQERTGQAFQILLSEKTESQVLEQRFLRCNGSPVWSISIFNRACAVATDEAPLFICFLQDITPQKLLEEKLRSTKALYRSLVENIGVGLSLIDAEHRILMVNPAMSRMFAKEPRDFLGKRCFREFEKRPDICSHCPGVLAMTSRQPRVVTTEGVCDDGRRFRVRIKAFPVFDADGRPGGFVELVEDLTAQIKMEMALQESEGRFRALAEAAPIGIFEVSAEGENTYFNPAWLRMSGLSMEESLGAGWITAVSEDDRQAVSRTLEQARLQGLPWQEEYRLLLPDGQLRWVQAAAVPVCDPQGQLQRYVGTVVDLTEQKKAMQKLADSEARFRSIYEKAGVGMVMVAAGGRIIDANPAFCAFVGYSPEALQALKIQALAHVDGDDGTDSMTAIFQSREAGNSVERCFVRKDGELAWGELTGVWISAGRQGQEFGVCIVQDITKKKEAQARLEYLVHHDELTGLPNGKLCLDRLNHAITKAARDHLQVGVLFIGLDRFGKIVSSFNHETGNRVLRQIADRLRGVVRRADTLARFGDTEFAILLEDVEKIKTTRIVAQIALRRIAEPLTVDSRAFHITASVGIGLYPGDGEGAEQLLRNASAAMNRAKQQGGDQFEYFTPELNVRTRQLLDLEADLRNALSREEIVLYFQPQVELRTREISGFEALVRWRHPRHGLIPAADFVPLAEETGLIVPLGEWVLRQACLQSMVWRRIGLKPVTMAVNISPRQFRRVDLPLLVRRILDETAHPPEYLELEITESMVMDDVEQAIDVMKQITGMGVRLAIDDFGTGYSSLHYLKRFPVERLKIDRTFVRDVLTDANDATIASAVLALAGSMNLKVVAEGIETAEQLAFFREKGCDYCQGFLFSRPIDAAGAAELLARRENL